MARPRKQSVKKKVGFSASDDVISFIRIHAGKTTNGNFSQALTDIIIWFQEHQKSESEQTVLSVTKD
jgi:hypothetical protein